jgi:uncharacterized MAPEG superfamily protein
VNETAPTRWGPVSFELSEEEARIAASHAAWRASLSGRLSRNHVAPLVAFSLFLAFAAILTFTGLIGRRLGEAALLLGAIAFMMSRMAAHWRLRGAQKNSLAAAISLQKAGPIALRLDPSGLHVETASGSRLLRFAECEGAEEAGGILYLWPREGEPVFIPARAFASQQAAQEFIARLRGEVRRQA